jgi:hypothetical protein
LIILQLKSTQNTNALTDISSIIDYIYDKYGYRIKGHEIQQLRSNIRKMTLIERASMISSFCTHHEIEYLTYHAPIFRYNIFDERWHSRITDSLCITIKEIERVFCNASLKNKVIIVFHLTNFISKELLPTISKEIKYKIMKRTREAFSAFYNNTNKDLNLKDTTRYCTFALENTYPKCFLNYAILNLCHPNELIEYYYKYGINTTLDLAHYQIYSNCLLYDKGNYIANIDRGLYGYAPSWKECIKILGNSLVQVHISDAKGTSYCGEGLPLKQGEIPIVDILNNISSLNKTIQGTIELTEGHLHKEKLQKQSADWLLRNIGNVFG